MNGLIIIIVIYIDDMILTWDDEESIIEIKRQLEKRFKMTDIGLLNYYLGLEVSQQ